MGTKEMDQWVKCWLLKHEDLNLSPETHIKASCSSTCDLSAVGFRQRQEDTQS